MANTSKDGSGTTIFLRAPYGTGVDDANSYIFGSAVYFQRGSTGQLPILDSVTPANNRGLPIVNLAGDGLAPYDVNTGAAGAATLRVVTAPDTRQGTNGDVSSKTGSNAAQMRFLADLIDGTANSRQPTDARLICTTCTPSNVAVTTTSSTAIAANSTRVSLVIVNTGINDVTIRRSATAVVAGTGIVIKAGGGTYEITATNLYTGVITAITAAGSSTLAVEECV